MRALAIDNDADPRGSMSPVDAQAGTGADRNVDGAGGTAAEMERWPSLRIAAEPPRGGAQRETQQAQRPGRAAAGGGGGALSSGRTPLAPSAGQQSFAQMLRRQERAGAERGGGAGGRPRPAAGASPPMEPLSMWPSLA